MPSLLLQHHATRRDRPIPEHERKSGPVLASLIGDYSRAEAHFADALATSDRIGAPPHLARTSADFARMLLTRGGAGHEGRAQALLMQARSIAERIGQGGVVAEVVEIEKRDGI
jgi:hypothetical protein